MANVDIETVVQDLNRRFAEPLPEFYNRRIIFWYDEDKEFEDKVDDVVLSNATLVKLTGTNNFAVKKLLCHDDRSGNYVVYSPISYAEPDDNWLIGMEQYSEEYRSDLNSIWMSEMGLPASAAIRKLIKEHRKFFNSKERRGKVAQLNNGMTSAKEVVLVSMAVICGIKDIQPNSIMKAVIGAGLDNDTNEKYQSLVNYNMDSLFWDMVAQGTGYRDGEEATLGKLIAHIFMTAATRTMGMEHFVGLDSFISIPHQSYCYDFLSDWLHSDDQGKIYNIARYVEEELNLYKRFKKIDISYLAETECFPCINECILTEIMTEIGDHIFRVEVIEAMVEKRRTMVWYDRVANHYDGILQVANMQVFFQEHSNGFHTVEAKQVWKEYTEEYYKMDTYYRMYHGAFAKSLTISYPLLDDLYKHVTEVVEGLYKNWFLGQLGNNWSDACADNLEKYGYIMDIPKQRDFYRTKIASANNKVVVIISDAFRYEVAASLAEQLRRENRANVELGNCQAIFPTVTKYGMAALLPNSELTTENKNGIISVYADGKPTDANYRDGILKKADPDSLAVQYKALLMKKTTEISEMGKNKNVIYIYHNRVDDMGHTDETQIFPACDDAIAELKNAVNMSVNYFNATKIYITADHGFLYTYSPLSEDDKVDKTTVSSEDVEVDRRYLITTKGAKPDYLLPVKFFDENAGYDAFAPRESIRIKKSGNGLNFVHGGISLQEMVVPVVDYTPVSTKSKAYKRNAGKYDTKPVELNLLSANRKIVNMSFILNFYQKDAVSDNRSQANYLLYFTDSNGVQISDTQKIIADKVSTDGQDRTFRCSFNLKSQAYSKTESYYLNIVEESNEVPPQKEEFHIDIAFAVDSFDFFS